MSLKDIHDAAKATRELAAQFGAVADAMEQLLAAGVSRHVLIVILQDMTGVKRTDINKILDAFERFRSHTLNT